MDYLTALIAGLLTNLIPASISMPLLLLAAALRKRYSAAFAGAGFALGFCMIGASLAAHGTQLFPRLGAAVGLIGAGAALLCPAARSACAALLTKVGYERDQTAREAATFFLLGFLVGATFLPLSGPTLSAAVALLSSGGMRMELLGIFAALGVGAVTPLLVLAYAFRSAFFSRTPYIIQPQARKTAAILLLAAGAIMLAGYDRALKSALLPMLHRSIVDLATRY